VDVVSLERGTLGQQIRVRMMDTGKVLNAQVDGRDHLDVKF
jgi:flagella basal body P-ring formation protein FlgA